MINDEENFKKLKSPIEISIRSFDNNKYIEHNNVTDRLNEVFGLSWNFEMVDKYIDLQHNEIAVICRLHYPTEDGMRFKDGAGGSWYEPKIGVGNAEKSSMSKALVKAASLIGITIRDKPITEELFKEIILAAKTLGIKYTTEQKTTLAKISQTSADQLLDGLNKKIQNK
jgi:hypothetical protein